MSLIIRGGTNQLTVVHVRTIEILLFEKVFLLEVKKFHGLNDDLKIIWTKKITLPDRVPNFGETKKRRHRVGYSFQFPSTSFAKFAIKCAKFRKTFFAIIRVAIRFRPAGNFRPKPEISVILAPLDLYFSRNFRIKVGLKQSEFPKILFFFRQIWVVC